MNVQEFYDNYRNITLLQALQMGFSVEAIRSRLMQNNWTPGGVKARNWTVEFIDYSGMGVPVFLQTETGEIAVVKDGNYWIFDDSLNIYEIRKSIKTQRPDGVVGSMGIEPTPKQQPEESGWWGGDGYRDR